MWDWYSRSASPAAITRNYDWPRRESARKNIQNNSWTSTLKCISTDLALGAHSHTTCFQAVRALQELFNPSHDGGTASMACLSPSPPAPTHPQGHQGTYNGLSLKTITILDLLLTAATMQVWKATIYAQWGAAPANISCPVQAVAAHRLCSISPVSAVSSTAALLSFLVVPTWPSALPLRLPLKKVALDVWVH